MLVHTVRDVIVVVAQRGRTRWGFPRRWTVLPEEFHRGNALLVAVAIGRGLVESDGGTGLRLTRAGSEFLNPKPNPLSKVL